MKINNIVLLVLIGAILLHLFSVITIPSIKDDTTNYNQVLQDYDSISNLYDSLQNDYNSYIFNKDSIIESYKNKYDSALEVQHEIIYDYETRIKDLNDINIVDNDSVTEYISKRIYNR